jgi:hypothetical protein
MYKIIAACAAVAVTALIALPDSAGAIERRADSMRNSDQIEVSSARRIHHYSHRYYGRHYYARSYYQPYYAYAPAPHWGPAPFPFIFGLPYGG